MLVFMIQWGGARYHPGPVNLLQPLALIAAGVIAGVVLVPLLERWVPAVRRRVRTRLRRRGALRAAATSEQRSRAVMSELCPHGWRADITLFEHPDTDELRPARVRLTWTELRDERGTPAVMRELWAPTVNEALQQMVSDRRTDETLEAIEQAAVFEGADWPEPD